MSMTILVVDDDPEIRDILHIYLRNEGYRVVEAVDGQHAVEVINREAVHLIILDVMMPKWDGIKACLKIREEHDVPIIMLSAKGEDIDKITGLSTGADDYVTKPFNPLELLARVKAQLRRQTLTVQAASASNEITIDALVINKDQHLVTVKGQEIALTPIEFAILLLLASHRGKFLISIKFIRTYGRINPPFTPKIRSWFISAILERKSKKTLENRDI